MKDASRERACMAVVLIDTSIWLDLERGRFNLFDFVEPGEIAICPVIAQELLQGAQAYPVVRNVVVNARMLDDPTPFERFERAAQIHRFCRMDGQVTVSLTECLIAATAIEHRVPLLQRDRSFEVIADHAPLELLRNV